MLQGNGMKVRVRATSWVARTAAMIAQWARAESGMTVTARTLMTTICIFTMALIHIITTTTFPKTVRRKKTGIEDREGAMLIGGRQTDRLPYRAARGPGGD